MDRETVERALADSKTRLELATRAASLGIWDWNVLTNEMVYSDIAKQICGFPIGQPVTYEQVVAVTHPEDLPRTRQMVRRALDPAVRAREPFEYRLRLADGSVRWVLAYGQAVFAEIDGQVRAARYVGTIQDITTPRQTEMALRDSEGRLRLAIDAARMAIWEFDVATGAIVGSAELNRLFGLAADARPTLDDLRRHYYPGERDRVRAAARAALERNERHFEIEYRIVRVDGEARWMLLRAEIELTAAREPRRVIGVLIDVTEQKNAAERQKLLLDELNHRVKNTLTMMQAITTLTLRHARDLASARSDIDARILALSRAHDLLIEQSGQQAGLRAVVRQALEPVASLMDRIRIDGPELALPPNLAVDLAMVLQELLTNAVKYGALSVPEGRLVIAWVTPGDDNVLRLGWQEAGRPPGPPPSRRGFGSRLIETLMREHHGEARFSFEADGLVCRLDLPL